MKSAHGMKSAFWSVAKYVLAITLLVFILRQADTGKVFGYMKKIPPFELVLSFVLITFAQIAAALRMRYLFRRSGLALNMRYSIILFYVGAFYNFLLPGGIGGDAYKVVLVRHRMNISTKQGVHIMLADRASGLCVIVFTMLGALMMMDLSALIPHLNLLLCVAGAITFGCYLFFCKWLLKQNPATMVGALPYSVGVQALWISALLLICNGLASGDAYGIEYTVLYCAASISGMLPVSVGGLGIKEMTYSHGAKLMGQYAHSGVDPERGIAISLCIFFLMLAASLPGLLWVNKVEKTNFS